MLRILLLDSGEVEVLFWLKRFTIHQVKIDTTLKTLIEMRQVFISLDKGSTTISFTNPKYRKTGSMNIRVIEVFRITPFGTRTNL